MTTADIISSVRSQLDDDLAGAKTVLNENLARSIVGNQVGSGNRSFILNNKRIIATTLIVTSDGTVVTVASEDDTRGRFTLTVAPATSCLATYDFQFFTDAELTQIIGDSLNFVSATVISGVVAGLQDALVYKAASVAATKLTSRTTPYYNAAAGSKRADKGDIGKKYAQLAKDLYDRAVAERTAFYGPRKGQASSPSTGRVTLTQRVWTPRR